MYKHHYTYVILVNGRELKMLSKRNPNRTIKIKQVQHDHINYGTSSRVEAEAGRQMGG